MTKEQRLQQANELIEAISRHGRRFFYCKADGRVARLELDARGKVWFLDDYRGARIYTGKVMGSPHDWAGFSHGGTLRSLVEVLSEYVTKGRLLSRHCIAPIRLDGESNIWGYSIESAAALREEAFKMAMFAQEEPVTA